MSLILPGLIASLLIYAYIKKADVYSAFISGALEALPRSSTGIILLAPFTRPHTMQLDERSTSMEITVCPARWFTGSFTKEP